MVSDSDPITTPDAPKVAPRSRRRLVWIVSLSIAAVSLVIAALVWTSSSDPAPVKAPAARAPAIRVAPVTRAAATFRQHYRGELVADTAELSAQSAGELRELHVRLGDRVKRGETLAVVDASLIQRELNEAKAQVNAAAAEQRRVQAELDAAISDRDRNERLRAEQLVTEQAAEAASARVAVLRAQLQTSAAQQAQAEARVSRLSQSVRHTRVIAPFDGAVAARHLDPGAVVQLGTPIVRLVAQGPLRVRFRVPESDLGYVRAEQQLTLTTRATGNRSYAGRVQRRAAEVSPVDRMVLVEGLLDEEYDDLLPGMYANITLTSGNAADAILVPNTALTERLHEGLPISGVFTIHESEARFVPVTILGFDEPMVAVEGPLQPGVPVAVFGVDALADGTPVRIVETVEPRTPATDSQPVSEPEAQAPNR